MQLGSVFQAQGYYFTLPLLHDWISSDQWNCFHFIPPLILSLTQRSRSEKKVTFCLCVLWWDSLLNFLTYFSWNLLQFRARNCFEDFCTKMKNSKIVFFFIKLISPCFYHNYECNYLEGPKAKHNTFFCGKKPKLKKVKKGYQNGCNARWC